MTKEWIRTDDLQFLKREAVDMFSVINAEKLEDEYIAALAIIDLNDYMHDEVDKISKAFGYKDYSGMRDIYKEDTNQIIAECISELEFHESNLVFFNNEDELNDWLRLATSNNSFCI